MGRRLHSLCWGTALLALGCHNKTAPTTLANASDTAVVESETCNGHLDLCDRQLTDVTLPGTHNSMSNADAGWIAANQQHSITRQLNDGIRSLMLDTVDWNGEPFLCHGYCELGAQPLEEGLAEVETFLAAHPREVVLIIFQDGLSTDIMSEALEASGLAARAWAGSDTMPTLRELIDNGTNLIITAEHGGPPPDWYHHAWDLIQDTPYSFSTAEEMTCDRLRGEDSNPLLLVNHWLGTPLPTATGAMEVNASAVLGARAAQCETERNQRINILAVDFYNHGDIFEVVNALNGIETTQ